MSKRKWIELYVDGSCLNNPGPGGWAALLRFQRTEKVLAGNARCTTNNRMELQAVIEGLKALDRPSRITVYTDSQYVQQGITVWIHKWKAHGWRGYKNNEIKNKDLWVVLENTAKRHNIIWNWVMGHNGNPFHDRVDVLAREEARKTIHCKPNPDYE